MRRPLIAACAALFSLTATTAFAAGQTATANLTVQATVADACGVTDATLSLGTVTPTNGVALPVGGTINVTCTLGTTFSVGLGDGLNASGGARRLRKSGTSNYLTYELHKDALGLTRFGDSVGERSGGLGLGIAATSVGVYGTVPSGQTADTGAYADTVQITLYY